MHSISAYSPDRAKWHEVTNTDAFLDDGDADGHGDNMVKSSHKSDQQQRRTRDSTRNVAQ